MKRQELFQLALMVCSFSEFLLNAQQKRQIKAIDPIVDFRVPQSFMESLQEGINEVYTSLQSDVDSSVDVQSAHNHLANVVALYDNTLHTTRYHQVNEDDKAFLQKMIDRIDNLIAQLEDDQGNKDQDTLRSMRVLCQELRSKIS